MLSILWDLIWIITTNHNQVGKIDGREREDESDIKQEKEQRRKEGLEEEMRWEKKREEWKGKEKF